MMHAIVIQYGIFSSVFFGACNFYTALETYLRELSVSMRFYFCSAFAGGNSCRLRKFFFALPTLNNIRFYIQNSILCTTCRTFNNCFYLHSILLHSPGRCCCRMYRKYLFRFYTSTLRTCNPFYALPPLIVLNRQIPATASRKYRIV